jgi:hypothetical protein
VTRLELARAEIARRRALAEAATAGPWRGGRVGLMGGRIGVVVSSAETGTFVLGDRDREARVEDAVFIAANDPAHVLRVLDAADATLDRHAPVQWKDYDGEGFDCAGCPGAAQVPWPCADAALILDLYAPQETT